MIAESREACKRLWKLGSRSKIGGGQGCHKFVPVLRGDGTRVSSPGHLFDQPSGELS